MMKSRFSGFLAIVLFSVLIWLPGRVSAQETLSAEEIGRYGQEARKLVSFLEFTFNTLGDPEVPVREKDVIINQSYAKMFESPEVQIEDDLDENRDVPVNKDVQAYLKDIDFFFREVDFKFTIEDIEHQINEKNQLFFKVTLNRNLQGITISGDTVNSNRIRYIEINLDDADQDLQIASIYTTKLNEKEELRKWWFDLPLVWRNILGDQIVLGDTLRMSDVLWYNDSLARFDFLVRWKMSRDTLSIEASDTMYLALSDTGLISASLLDRQLKRITAIDTLNVAGRSEIISLEPLAQLSELRRVDCSHTLVASLMPLRNITNLEYLNCSHTAVSDLDALRYSTKLQELIIDGTLIKDIGPTANFVKLEKFHFNQTVVDTIEALASLENLKDLEMASTPISGLNPLRELTGLERLDFSETEVMNIEPLSGLSNIYFLKFERTDVHDLQPLRDMMSLHFLFINHTRVHDLSPLSGLPELNKIYCDRSAVTRAEAIEFMEQNPQVLVIYGSADLSTWWKKLPAAWKDVFDEMVQHAGDPTREELHQITRIKELNISGNEAISSLEPLSSLPMLVELNCQGTSVPDLEPLASLADLTYLNFSATPVSSLAPLERLSKLRVLNFDNTGVNDLSPIMQLPDLEKVYCDYTAVPEDQVIGMMKENPDCLVVYQTPELESWWENLPPVWQLLGERFIGSENQLNREQLQQIVNLRTVDLNDIPGMAQRSLEIVSLEPIRKMILLEELRFTNTRISSLEPLRSHNSLRVLIAPNNPIETLNPLSEVKHLEVLDVQNTPIENLEFLATLDGLNKLNCSGTQIRKLYGLEYLHSLTELNCYNTDIRNLKYIEDLPALQLVRCYNTRISERRIKKFREARPQVEVVYY